MPYQHELTWIATARKWRKRYLGKTYYLKSPSQGKKDRKGYLSALREWERLKAYLDGLGPCPYTHTGAIIPEGQALQVAPVYIPPAPIAREPQVATVPMAATRISKPQPVKPEVLPAFIESVGIFNGLHPELVASKGNGNPYADERRIEALAEFWLEQRKKQVDRGELSLSQWDEDRTKLKGFRDFLHVNYPTLVYVDDIQPAVLNLYRDKQWEFVDAGGEHGISRVTLRKRLGVVSKWFGWLVDQNILATPPKDLRAYGRVKLEAPMPLFWSPEEIKLLAEHASERTKLYIMLGLNLGYTQKDIATLTPDMVNWDTGIVVRDRHKTGVPSKAKLWGSTLKLLAKHRNPKPGPVLIGENGNPLQVETVNKAGNVVTVNSISLAFDRLKRAKKTGFKGDPRSFKHLRKSAANEIERTRPELTGLFLAHSEGSVKRHYVSQHFNELFTETDKLAKLFGF